MSENPHAASIAHAQTVVNIDALHDNNDVIQNNSLSSSDTDDDGKGAMISESEEDELVDNMQQLDLATVQEELTTKVTITKDTPDAEIEALRWSELLSAVIEIPNPNNESNVRNTFSHWQVEKSQGGKLTLTFSINPYSSVARSISSVLDSLKSGFYFYRLRFETWICHLEFKKSFSPSTLNLILKGASITEHYRTAFYLEKNDINEQKKEKKLWNSKVFRPARQFLRRLRNWKSCDATLLNEIIRLRQGNNTIFGRFGNVFESIPDFLRIRIEPIPIHFDDELYSQAIQYLTYISLLTPHHVTGYPLFDNLNNLQVQLQEEFHIDPFFAKFLDHCFYLCASFKYELKPGRPGSLSRVRDEGQIDGMLWTPILSAAFHQGAIFTGSPMHCISEYSIHSLPACNTEAYADFTALSYKHNFVFLAVEYDVVDRDNFRNDLSRHKDEDRMIGCLTIMILHIASELHCRGVDYETLQNVRVWGGLVNDGSMQFIEARMFIENNEKWNEGCIEVIIHRPKDWLVTFVPHDNPSLPMTDAEHCIKSLSKLWTFARQILDDFQELQRLFSRPKLATTRATQFVFPENTHLPTSFSSSSTPAKENGSQKAPSTPIRRAETLLLEAGFAIIECTMRGNGSVMFQLVAEGRPYGRQNYIGLLKSLNQCNEAMLLGLVRGAFNIVPVLFSEVIEDDQGDSWQLIVEPLFYPDAPWQDLTTRGDCYFEMTLRMCRDALNGLQELHTLRILHRDLKPQHLLYDRRRERWFWIDLNSAILLTDESDYISDDLTVWPRPPGTHPFRAPEVENRDSYSFSSDIYSLGVTLRAMVINSDVIRPLARVRMRCGRDPWYDLAFDIVDRMAAKMMHEMPLRRLSLQRASSVMENLLQQYYDQTPVDKYNWRFK